MDGLVQALRGMGTTRLVIMGLVGVGLLGFFLFIATRLTTAEQALLYGDLSAEDSGQIASRLEGLGVPYQLSAGGSQILVPSDQVLNLRVMLAEQGLPGGGSIGYELFDQSGGLGTTSFVQNVNLVRALEGELSRTIGAMDRVKNARVHVVMPRRELFQRDRDEPTASVFLRLQGGGRPSQGQIAAIQHLVAAAIPGLSPDRVAIVDGRGNMLASGSEDANEIGTVAARSNEFQRTLELELKRTVEALLERSLGQGKVRAEVAAEVDFDRLTVNEESYDPDGQVVRSTQTVEESSSSTEADPTVSVGNNLPDAETGEGGAQVQSNSARTEETVNFEISRTVRNHIRESGTIERLSVAVLVDGRYQVDEEAETRSYVPRSEEELAQISALVRSAIGFDEERGDSIEVVNMQFAEPEIPEEPIEPLFGLDKRDYFKIAEILVLAIVAVLVILLVLRPLVTRVFSVQVGTGGRAGGGAGAAAGALPGQAGQQALAGPGGDGADMAGGDVPGAGGIEDVDEEGESMIDLNRVEGRVKASSVKKIGEIIDKHPDEALTILRGWMAEGAA